MPQTNEVRSHDHNIRGWFADITTQFVASRGDLAQRLRYKNELRKACRILNVAWEQACQWFRETVREIERLAREELLAKYKKKYGSKIIQSTAT